MAWPTQSQCDSFYGNPRNSADPTKPSPTWEAKNLVRVIPPFAVFYDSTPVTGLRMHTKVKDSLDRVFLDIWDAAGRSQAKIDAWGMSKYAGGYNFRPIRGSTRLSMHSYGCAVDFDPARNAQRDETPNFATVPEVVTAFEKEGWIWGGRWSAGSRDGMHFQAAIV